MVEMMLLQDCAWGIHCMSELPVWFRLTLIANTCISFKHLAVRSESQKDLLSISRHTSQILKENMSITYKWPILLLQVILVSANKLTRYIEPCQLTEDFGGTLTYDHMDWLNKRLVSYLCFGIWGYFNVSFLSPDIFICVGAMKHVGIGHLCSRAFHLHE